MGLQKIGNTCTLLGYLIFLILGAHCVSEGGEILGEKYDATIIGGLAVAWLNTLPETIFFITALENDQPNFAVGAISGSVIVVCTIAVGCCIYIGGKASSDGNSVTIQKGVKDQALMLLGSCVMIFLLIGFGFSYFLGLLGILFYAVFVLWTIFHKKVQEPSLGNSIKGKIDENPSLDAEEEEEEQPTWKGVAYLALGGGIIYLFSLPFINAVVEVGNELQMAPLALAYFFAPIASEAPEILESISLSRKGKLQNINIAFSNLVGGTISKTTLLAGILSLYGAKKSFTWEHPAYPISFLLVILCAGAVGVQGFQSKLPIVRGQMLLGLFLFCSVVQFSLAYWGGSELPV